MGLGHYYVWKQGGEGNLHKEERADVHIEARADLRKEARIGLHNATGAYILS
jgi:hypothetical protein